MTSVLTSSLHFIYTDIQFVFDRAMAWFPKIFYWFDSIYQWLTSGRTSWPRGEGGDMLINIFCVRGFKMHPCRLVFKNTELSSVSTKTDFYPIFLITHQKNSDHKKLVKNWLANYWNSSKQIIQAIKRWKNSVCSKRKSDGQCHTFFYWEHSRHGNLKIFR